MKLSLELTAAVRRDLAEERLWYDQQRPGLGHQLATAFYAAVDRISQAPTAQTRFGSHYRRRKLQGFRHSVYFRVTEDTIFIMALIHNRRGAEFVSAQLQRG